MNRTLLLLFTVVFTVCTFLTSCSSSETITDKKPTSSVDDLEISDTEENDMDLYQQHLRDYKNPENSVLEICKKHLSEGEIERTVSFINDIDFEASPEWSSYFYDYRRSDSDKLTEIGVGGIPVLLTGYVDDIDFDANDYYGGSNRLYKGFLAHGFYAICRTDLHEITNTYGVYDDMASRSFISFFYNRAKTESAKIIASDKTVKEKLDEIKFFGILVLPEIIAEINKGNEEYAEYFTTIGLHLTVPEFMDIIVDSSSSETKDQKYERIKTAEGSENFDYNAWYAENKEDLDNLFKFLDAYCAEYEAENK